MKIIEYNMYEFQLLCVPPTHIIKFYKYLWTGDKYLWTHGATCNRNLKKSLRFRLFKLKYFGGEHNADIKFFCTTSYHKSIGLVRNRVIYIFFSFSGKPTIQISHFGHRNYHPILTFSPLLNLRPINCKYHIIYILFQFI